MKIMSIDYGDARTGVAFCDEREILASAYCVIKENYVPKLADRIVDTKVEIQIRTVAMDFWASLEHKIHYKFEGDAPAHIKSELVECAKLVADLDARMLSLNEEILSISQQTGRE